MLGYLMFNVPTFHSVLVAAAIVVGSLVTVELFNLILLDAALF